MYEQFHFVYGTYITEEAEAVADLLAKKEFDEDNEGEAYLENVGFTLLYTGSGDQACGYLGAVLNKSIAAWNMPEFIHDQESAARTKLMPEAKATIDTAFEELPEALKAALPKPDFYYVWHTS